TQQGPRAVAQVLEEDVHDPIRRGRAITGCRTARPTALFALQADGAHSVTEFIELDSTTKWSRSAQRLGHHVAGGAPLIPAVGPTAGGSRGPFKTFWEDRRLFSRAGERWRLFAWPDSRTQNGCRPGNSQPCSSRCRTSARRFTHQPSEARE